MTIDESRALMNEEWRVVEEFPLYDVSNLGQVRNSNTLVELTPQTHSGTFVTLSSGGKSINRSVSKLMRKAFG